MIDSQTSYKSWKAILLPLLIELNTNKRPELGGCRAMCLFATSATGVSARTKESTDSAGACFKHPETRPKMACVYGYLSHGDGGISVRRLTTHLPNPGPVSPRVKWWGQERLATKRITL